jgi:hypothetical protein
MNSLELPEPQRSRADLHLISAWHEVRPRMPFLCNVLVMLVGAERRGSVNGVTEVVTRWVDFFVSGEC